MTIKTEDAGGQKSKKKPKNKESKKMEKKKGMEGKELVTNEMLAG